LKNTSTNHGTRLVELEDSSADYKTRIEELENAKYEE
jgi:hypothetical protein